MKEEFERWFSFAVEDLSMAKLALREGIYNQVCFHSQQCVEKVLKGFIALKGKIPPKTHKLADLLYLLEETHFDNIKDRILLLDRFYIVSRYPDAIIEDAYPKEKEAEEALEVAEEAIKIAIKIKMGNQR